MGGEGGVWEEREVCGMRGWFVGREGGVWVGGEGGVWEER